MGVIRAGPFRKANQQGSALALQPITANLLWRYDSPTLLTVPDDTQVTTWVDSGPNAADITWPGLGFVFVPPYPHYYKNKFGMKPGLVYNETQAATSNELDVGSQAAFAVPVLGVSHTHYFVADVGDANTWGGGNGGNGVLHNYPTLGAGGRRIVLPFYGGSGLGGTGLTMGFATKIGATTTLHLVAERLTGATVLAWVFDGVTGISQVWQGSTLLGSTGPDADVIGGFNFGQAQSVIFSDFAGADGLQSEPPFAKGIAADYAYSVAHSPAQIATMATFFKSSYSLP